MLTETETYVIVSEYLCHKLDVDLRIEPERQLSCQILGKLPPPLNWQIIGLGETWEMAIDDLKRYCHVWNTGFSIRTISKNKERLNLRLRRVFQWNEDIDVRH